MKTIKEVLETPGACIVDVRNTYEFEEEHILGALNIPLDQVMGSIEKFKSLPKPMIVYCRSGGRSGMAAMILKQAGVEEVYNGGGIYDLKQFIN